MGICFDFYRILRWRMSLNRVSTLLGDLFFSVISVVVIFYFAQKANYLEFRFYLFGGSLLGLLLYLRFISKYVKWFFNKVLNIIGKMIIFSANMVVLLFKSIANLLTYLMSFPYRVLRWLALLLFRMLEAVAGNTLFKVKLKISKRPKE